MCIGVNHLALDTERIQQEELLKKVKQLELELKDSVSYIFLINDISSTMHEKHCNNTFGPGT